MILSRSSRHATSVPLPAVRRLADCRLHGKHRVALRARPGPHRQGERAGLHPDAAPVAGRLGCERQRSDRGIRQGGGRLLVQCNQESPASTRRSLYQLLRCQHQREGQHRRLEVRRQLRQLPPGYLSSPAMRVSDSGYIAGFADSPGPLVHRDGIRWDPDGTVNMHSATNTLNSGLFGLNRWGDTSGLTEAVDFPQGSRIVAAGGHDYRAALRPTPTTAVG